MLTSHIHVSAEVGNEEELYLCFPYFLHGMGRTTYICVCVCNVM